MLLFFIAPYTVIPAPSNGAALSSGSFSVVAVSPWIPVTMQHRSRTPVHNNQIAWSHAFVIAGEIDQPSYEGATHVSPTDQEKRRGRGGCCCCWTSPPALELEDRFCISGLGEGRNQIACNLIGGKWR
nr:hypothetical protein Iba_chr15cCG5100 [Ipomoea batatas]